jgi:predicted nucleotidyltransferase
MPGPRLPPPVAALASDLAGMAGTVAVVLGGPRATATHRPDSDWDLGVYYRGSQRPLDPADLRRLGYTGHVSELGEWGPIVNGGAWLTIDSTPVDVLFRDLRHRGGLARRGPPAWCSAPASKRPRPCSPDRAPRPPSSAPRSQPSAPCWAPSRSSPAETTAARRGSRYEAGAGAG